ncbi:MAG: DUF937 domain-containing protein [Saprospiraceae bacterium]|jgi:hypothetical protein|nr:DUF937 domain-containing protein [Saprospiraceae bacterium]
MNITDLLQSQLTGNLLEQLSQKAGISDTQKTSTAANGIMNVLLGALAQNAAKPGGASSLANALDRDHDGSMLDNIMDMFTGQAQPANPKAADGEGILGHILGNRKEGAIETVSKVSGLDSNQIGSLMISLAPMIMGALGKAKREDNLDEGGLAGMLSGVLGGISGQQKQVDPKMAIINAFLDKNKDGNISDDLMRMGGSFLGKLFGKK